MAKKTAKKSVAKTEELEEVVVTQEMLDSNPELAEQGVSVGDTVQLPAEEQEEIEEVVEAPKKAKKQTGAIAIIKGDNFVRKYTADQADLVDEFLSKDPAYKAIPLESIEKILVPFDNTKEDKSIERSQKVFSLEQDGEDFIDFAILYKNEIRSSCIVVLSK